MPSKFDPISLAGNGPNQAYPVSPASVEEAEGKFLFLEHPRVVQLPEEGKITFYFKRGPVTVREPTEHSPGSASVDLRLTEICDVCACEVETPASDAQESSKLIDELFAKVRGKKSDGDDS